MDAAVDPSPGCPLESGHSVTTRLPVREPFDFQASLAFIRSFPPMTGQQGAGGGELTLALRENGVTMGVHLTPSPGESALDCVVTADRPIAKATLDAAADRLSFFLGLQDDLTEFYRIADQDPPFARVVKRLYGYHQVKFPAPLELLCWAILCQRVPMAVARTMKRALTEAVGNRVRVRGETRWAFPDAEQMAAFDEGELHRLIGNQRKARYIHLSVRQWSDLDEDFLRAGPYDEVREHLLRLPGIGPWSASFLLVRGLGRMERIGLDKEMSSAVQRVYGRNLDERAFRRLADHYGSSQGYWGHYLRAGG